MSRVPSREATARAVILVYKVTDDSRRALSNEQLDPIIRAVAQDLQASATESGPRVKPYLWL